jgi:hypothetical protein
MNLTSWPDRMRVIVRKERPHPGAQLRITDADGHRITAFATNTARGQLADLELRHRRRARCEDRIRNSKDTGLTNLPLHDFAQNQIWCAIVALAVELTAWMQMLALTRHEARRWEPKRLRLRLFSLAARLAHHGRARQLHLSEHSPWARLLASMIDTLQAIPAPGRERPHPSRRTPRHTSGQWKPAPTPSGTGQTVTPARQNHPPPAVTP